MDNKTAKLVKMLLSCGFAVGEAYSIKYLYGSGIKPWFKWNLIVVMALVHLPDSIKCGLKSIEEFWEVLDEPSGEESPETVEES